MIVNKDTNTAHTQDILSDLYKLIEALDRRVPRLERLGESQIAHDASEIRERAVSLIQRIEGDTRKD
jgi:predicted DNA-binding transcriptional regulator AlpA